MWPSLVRNFKAKLIFNAATIKVNQLSNLEVNFDLIYNIWLLSIGKILVGAWAHLTFYVDLYLWQNFTVPL